MMYRRQHLPLLLLAAGSISAVLATTKAPVIDSDQITAPNIEEGAPLADLKAAVTQAPGINYHETSSLSLTSSSTLAATEAVATTEEGDELPPYPLAGEEASAASALKKTEPQQREPVLKTAPEVPDYDTGKGVEKPLLTEEVPVAEDLTMSTADRKKQVAQQTEDETVTSKSADYTVTPKPDEGLKTPWQSFCLSFIMIAVSEIGDKTFLIAALMAMRHSRMTVYSAASSALILMTFISAVLGHAVPTLISKKYTDYLASFLFLVFGLRMLREAYGMSRDEGVDEEMQQVEAELTARSLETKAKAVEEGSVEKSIKRNLSTRSSKPNLRRSTSSPRLSDDEQETLSRHWKPNASHSYGFGSSTVRPLLDGFHNLCSLVLSPAWVQTFVMTFLGEWGDRSQIATIAMAAGQDYWFVIIGAIVGHGSCTAAAVVGGKLLASRISLKTVTYFGAFAFLAFCLLYFYEAFTWV